MNRNILFIVTCVLFYFSSTAQTNISPDHDTTFFRSYKGTIITRIYFSKKYTDFKLNPPGDLPVMNYHANTTFNIGVGITYRSLSLSISRGLNFLKSEHAKGRTHILDLQSHLYKRKWTIDAMAEFYKGYYLAPRGLGSPDGQSYNIRPDIGVKLIGASVCRVLNHRRFSYGAGLSQNAWQRKSAGTFLIGAQSFYIDMHADSAFAPRQADSLYHDLNIHKVHLFQIGPGIGYAYTFVIKEHYFLLGSLNANFNVRYSREIGNGINDDKIGFSPSFLSRLGTGYSESRWGISFVWIGSWLHTNGKSTGYDYSISTGGFQLTFARRIAVSREMRDVLEHRRQIN